MSKPIVHAGRALTLSPAQADAAISGELKVALAYRQGRKRRIRKGLLRVYGCPCCGIYADLRGANAQIRHVSFTNLFSLFHTRLIPAHD